MEREKILEVYEKGPDAVVDLVQGLIQSFTAEIRELKERVKTLENQLNLNSRNSSKPPSSDGFRKPTNLRKSGGKKGGPSGHQGYTLHQSQTPDEIVVHRLTTCPHCATSLDAVTPGHYVKRQVFDVPLPRMVVTEHQAEATCCPCCLMTVRASFPDGVNAPVQYGDGISAWAAYLSVYQLLPLERIGQLFADLTGYRPSEATLLSRLEDMACAVQTNAIPVIREHLRKAPVLHADETGMRVTKQPHWLHVLSDPSWTLLQACSGRVTKAVEEMAILGTFEGIVIHDCYISYFKPQYHFKHALCNAHLMRECQAIAEHDGHAWATEMKELLQLSWKLTKAARAKKQPLCDKVISETLRTYDDILVKAKMECAKDIVPEKTGPRGRKCKSKATNLQQRFEVHKESILRFLSDEIVPFDNNQAERDLRMAKVKQKISGVFRSSDGIRVFAVLRSFISTLLKQGLPLHSSLISILRGQIVFQPT